MFLILENKTNLLQELSACPLSWAPCMSQDMHASPS